MSKAAGTSLPVGRQHGPTERPGAPLNLVGRMARPPARRVPARVFRTSTQHLPVLPHGAARSRVEHDTQDLALAAPHIHIHGHLPGGTAADALVRLLQTNSATLTV
jgi:hypothetical protein